jgi:hypothetical protein
MGRGAGQAVLRDYVGGMMIYPIKCNFASKELLDAMKRDIERFISQPAVREAMENHKSSWIPNSKGGEPNCRR